MFLCYLCLKILCSYVIEESNTIMLPLSPLFVW